MDSHSTISELISYHHKDYEVCHFFAALEVSRCCCIYSTLVPVSTLSDLGIFALFGFGLDRLILFAQCSFSSQCYSKQDERDRHQRGSFKVPPELAHAIIFVPVHARPNTRMYGCVGMRTECCVEPPPRALALWMLPLDAEN